MQVIGAGVGRTGTYSLKIAINQLGLGPCHHMEAVLQNMPAQVPLWSAAIYAGFGSAVDWPTAAFFRELAEAYPAAKFVLTHRSPESWADSFGATIYKLLAERHNAPPEMHAWLEMCAGVSLDGPFIITNENGFGQIENRRKVSRRPGCRFCCW